MARGWTNDAGMTGAPAHRDLRGPSRLVDAPAGRGPSLADLPGAGAEAGGARPRAGLHARRVAAAGGTSLLRFLGLPADQLFRAHQPLRHATGPDVLRGPSAP